jgi:hypothetical protein
MQLCYFDENKHSDQSPDFFIGGIIVPDTKATSLEQTLREPLKNPIDCVQISA